MERFFPLFVDLNNKKVLVIGGGSVAERRINALLSFGAEITVISPIFTESIKILEAASALPLNFIESKYKNGDIAALMPFFVIAATNDRKTNHCAMKEATSLDIPISVADCREECTFYFPAIAENDDYIAGIVSKNGNHTGVSQTAEKIRGTLNLK